MNLTPMRYKGYTWPHNPEIYTIGFTRRLAALKEPFGGYCLQDLGREARIMRGEGTFAGESAYEEFRKLAEVFYDDGPGLLVHPLWQTASAYFVTLTLEEKPQPDCVRYSFAFWEDGEAAAGLRTVSAAQSTAVSAPAGAERTYTVKKGDTLWGIARSFGVTLQSLLAVNPQIKNPNLIYPGEKVRLP